MIIIISSSKSMVEKPSSNLSIPLQSEKANHLKKIIKQTTIATLTSVFACSEEKCQEYLNLYDITAKTKAIEAYNGVVFKQFRKDDMDYLNKHVRIISALYGLLRPADAISPYRLDFKNPLKIDNKSLYAYWDDSIYNLIADHLIINLASEEYAKTIRSHLTTYDTFVDIDFIEIKNGKATRNSTNLKKARGLFLKYLIENKIEDIKQLKNFNLDNYSYDSSSSSDKLVFKRTI